MEPYFCRTFPLRKVAGKCNFRFLKHFICRTNDSDIHIRNYQQGTASVETFLLFYDKNSLQGTLTMCSRTKEQAMPRKQKIR